MDTQTVLKYVMNSPENTNPNVLKGMLDQLSGGGGGSSDFSTAEVTVNANQQFEFYAPLINDEHGYLGAYDNINPDESETLTVGLYKGKAVTRFYTSGVVSVSGNAQLMNEQILITGDCTITIS